MKRFAVLGENIPYSLSPKIHSAIFKFLGIDASYSAIDVPALKLESAVGDLKRNFDGFNVTKPYKTEITRFLARDLSEIGAVNTVKRENGELVGYGTDGYGFKKSFTRAFGSPEGKTVLVLGAGGAARVVVAELKALGASVYINNRTMEKAEKFADEFGASLIEKDAKGFFPEIAVNCVATQGADFDPMSGFSRDKLVAAFDLVYGDTEFLRASRASGAETKDGTDMLIYQAIKADEIFLDTDLSGREDALAEKIKTILKEEIR